MALDGYQQSLGVWIDSTGNPLTYLAWCHGQPDGVMENGVRYLNWWNQHNCLDDDYGVRGSKWTPKAVICVKCSPKYLVPEGYSCLETDFGLVVIKSYTKQVTVSEARNICAADEDYVHLSRGHNTSFSKQKYFFFRR